jgi:membrane-bound serine protease (ClpP class)
MSEDILFNSVAWVNAGGLFLIAIGVCFVVGELFLPAFGLFGFAGVAALIIGTVILDQTGYITSLDLNIPLLLSVAVGGLALSGLGGWYAWKLHRRKISTGPESLLGDMAEIVNWSGTSGHVRIQGDIWQAYADTPFSGQTGDKVLVCLVDHVKLKIRPQEKE